MTDNSMTEPPNDDQRAMRFAKIRERIPCDDGKWLVTEVDRLTAELAALRANKQQTAADYLAALIELADDLRKQADEPYGVGYNTALADMRTRLSAALLLAVGGAPNAMIEHEVRETVRQVATAIAPRSGRCHFG